MRLITFGYRYKRDAPIGADIVFDARCLLEDPAEKEELANFTGRDLPVIQYLNGLPDVQNFVVAAVGGAAPFSAKPFVVAVACHSGRHRSVYIAERVAKILGVEVEHLDMTRVPCEDFAPDCV